MSKLNHGSDWLWQRPKKKVQNADKVWYDNSPVGRDPPNNTMKNLSMNAGLSIIYKNHSIRATVVTNLDNKGFEARHIMATTGHKLEISIKNYARRCSTRKRREMSDALATSLIKDNDIPVKKKPKIEPNRAESVPQNATAGRSNDIPSQPNFDLASATLETINSDDLSQLFGIEEDILDTPDVLDIVTQIEKENAELAHTNPCTVKTIPPTTQPNTINVSNVSNVQQQFLI